MPKLQRANKSAFSGGRTAQPVIKETLYFGYNEEFEEISDINYFTSAAMEIKRCFRTVLEEYVKIGSKLREAKERIKNKVQANETQFIRWVSIEFGDIFSIDSAQSYMNLSRMAERFGIETLKEQQLKGISTTSLALLGRKTTPEGAIQLVFNSDVPLTHRDISKLLSHLKKVKSDAPTTELIFEILPRKRQSLSLAKVQPNEQQEQTTLRQSQGIETVTESFTKAIDVPFEVVSNNSLLITEKEILSFKDNWSSLIKKIQDEYLKVCFADFTRDARPEDYWELCEAIYPKVADGGVLITPVSQSTLTKLTNYTSLFNVTWVFSVLLDSKESVKINNFSVESSWLPIVMMAKGNPNANLAVDCGLPVNNGDNSTELIIRSITTAVTSNFQSLDGVLYLASQSKNSVLNLSEKFFASLTTHY